MRTPTDILRDEHVLILHALDVVEVAARHLGGPDALPDSWWDEVVGWFRRFADRTHHGKEETFLFPAMVEAGLPREGGPIAVMLAEHQEGRRLIAAMTEPAHRAQAARAYVRLLRAHIDKENGILFPMADEIVDEAGQRALLREFERVTQELGPEGSSSHAEASLQRLGAALVTPAVSGRR